MRMARQVDHRRGSRRLGRHDRETEPPGPSAAPSLPGTYNVTDGFPVTQGMLNARLEAALGRPLHSLDELGWGADGILFGPSRRIADRTFGDLTGWQPQAAPAAGSLAGLCYLRS